MHAALLCMALLLGTRPAAAEPPFSLPSRAELSKLRSATIYTNRGNILIELFPDDAPWHVANFKYLSDKGFYRRLQFNAYESGFFIQGGGPTQAPYSGPGYELSPEFNSHKNLEGMVGMFRRPDAINPNRNSHGSQFYILLEDSPQLDGLYTVFGKVISGMDVVRELRKEDRLEDVRVFIRPDGRAR